MSEKVYYSENGIRKEAKGELLNYIVESQESLIAQQRLFEAEQKAKEELKQSAIAKLAAIGLTEEEAKIIIGVN